MSYDPYKMKELDDEYQARSEYGRAQWRGTLQRISTLFGNRRRELISLSATKSMLKSAYETFVGIKTVAKIDTARYSGKSVRSGALCKR